MANNEDLKELASQLRQPQGAKGIEIANMMNETNIKMTIHSIDLLNVQTGNNILELGHGNCGHLSYLLSKENDLKYQGLEMSALMIEEAERINQKHIQANQASFHLYEGSNIPFADNSFDRIFTVNTIYFWKEPLHLLNELYRVLKPIGLLNITFAQKSFMQQLPFTQFAFELYDTEKIKTLANQSHFKEHTMHHTSEKIKSKTGEMVDREFTTVTFTN